MYFCYKFWWRLYNYRELKRDSCSWEIVSTLVFSGYVTHFKLVSGNWNKRLLIFHLSAIIWIQKMNMISHKRQLFINPLILIACTYTFANSSARLSQCCCVCPWHWQMRESYEAKCTPPPLFCCYSYTVFLTSFTSSPTTVCFCNDSDCHLFNSGTVWSPDFPQASFR